MSTEPKPHAIHLHIDELVVRGFNHIDADALTLALQEVLHRELQSTSARPLRDVDLPRIRAAVTLPAPCSAAQLGGALAQTLVGVVRRDTPDGNHHD